MPDPERPVFFDASGSRQKWSLRAVALLLVLAATAAVGFAFTLAWTPVPDALYPVAERSQAMPISHQLATLRRRVGRWLPIARSARQRVDPITVGFYAPWDPDSKASLALHIGQLDWVVPALASVTGNGRTFAYVPDLRLHQVLAATPHHAKVLPMIQNAANDRWDGAGMAAILHDPARRRAMLDWTAGVIAREKGAGVVFDLEELPPAARPDYLRFLTEARARFAPQRLLVALALPVGDPVWNVAAFARVADRVILMDYDEHSPGDVAGPIASQGWFVANLTQALQQAPPGKIILAIGNYAYDWHDNVADNMSAEEAWLAAYDSEALIRFDPASGNTTFAYEERGSVHTIWMLDAASAWNQLRAADLGRVAGVAIWRLGSEDPGLWRDLAAYRSGKAPDLATIHPIGNVDVEGSGELLRIEAEPRDGARTLTFGAGGVIRDEHFQRLPTPYQVRRGGDRPGMVALTFDDGPDPKWTPLILDILARKHAPGTFFVIGENAVSQPGLLNRILGDGSELGNHSYTHPNMARESDTGIRLQLNITQRLMEAYTGRSTRLFRAPYFGDAEPTTTDELGPALAAQKLGYLNVGLHVDPGDWKRPGAEAIIKATLDQVASAAGDRSERVVLLHDGGGDRSQTVAALPAIIDGLRARGLKLVRISELAGATHDAVNPSVKGFDLLQVRADVGVFLAIGAAVWITKWLFFVAITLGIARAVLMTGLAIRSRFDPEAPTAPPINAQRFVSVLIPAFNEDRVIVGSVRRVLDSQDVRIEVIVIDDGSRDATSQVVSAAFADDPRVGLLTLANGGKARALNRGLEIAAGDVIIALDADTQFEPTTISRLARWFADPGIGAVAGNAKVGNRVNLVTRWQSVEYVTSQNLERRALTLFDAITVVPGAVGAWRRAALDAVGGYPVDTLAEDQDLTIAIQRAGWRVGYDIDAVAWTEAPETFAGLARQRYRWAFGTLQCLWKHAAILRLRQPAGLAWVGLPQAWLFQIAFAVVSPIIDLALVTSLIATAVRVSQHGWAQTQSDVLRMAAYWVAFTAIDVACGIVAYALEPQERRCPILLLVAQRFVYRQIMYWVVIRAITSALGGLAVGWGKLERTGRVAAPRA